MRIAQNMDELKRNLDTSKKLILYGSGWAGKTICKFLKTTKIPISAFAVTVLTETKETEGFPVYAIDDILRLHSLDEIYFILAITKTNHAAVEKELNQRNITSYFALSDALICQMTVENRKADAQKAALRSNIKNAKKMAGYLVPGYLDSDYAEKRLIIRKIEGVPYVEIPKETLDFAYVGSEYEKCPDVYRQILEACYCPDRYIPDVALLHTFNTVCNIDRPWCASFETAIPRMRCETKNEKEHFLRLIDAMKRSSCKALYALCRNTYEIQKEILMMHLLPEQDIKLLMEKTHILHPPQDILITEREFEKKHDVGRIHFIFIGSAFFIKGGREIIQVLSEFEDRFDFDLTLISSLQYNDYFTKTPYEEMVKYKTIIHQKNWIDYYESLPNVEVLEKCKDATVGLLPSVADTYGYAVLEMQAAGCPVVTTNVRAFPETNNENCGWICRLPIDRLGFCMEQDQETWSTLLKTELRRCFYEIFSQPEKIKEKGRKAMERIRKMHDPHAYQKELRKNLEEKE